MKLKSIEVVSGGEGYTFVPEICFEPPCGIQAAGVVEGGILKSVVVSDQGEWDGSTKVKAYVKAHRHRGDGAVIRMVCDPVAPAENRGGYAPDNDPKEVARPPENKPTFPTGSVDTSDREKVVPKAAPLPEKPVVKAPVVPPKPVVKPAMAPSNSPMFHPDLNDPNPQQS